MAEQRYQAVMAVIGDGLSISQTAEKVGMSRQTAFDIYQKIRRRHPQRSEVCGEPVHSRP